MLEDNKKNRNTLQKTRERKRYQMKQKRKEDGGRKARGCHPLLTLPFSSVLSF